MTSLTSWATVDLPPIADVTVIPALVGSLMADWSWPAKCESHWNMLTHLDQVIQAPPWSLVLGTATCVNPPVDPPPTERPRASSAVWTGQRYLWDYLWVFLSSEGRSEERRGPACHGEREQSCGFSSSNVVGTDWKNEMTDIGLWFLSSPRYRDTLKGASEVKVSNYSAPRWTQQTGRPG